MSLHTTAQFGSSLGKTSVRDAIFNGEIDYSFSELPTLSDILDEIPRAGPSQAQIAAMISKSQAPDNDDAVDDFNASCRPWEEKKQSRVPKAKTILAVLKLNNNSLGSLDGFTTILPKIILQPADLRILDLSFNNLVTIDPCIAEQCPNLHVLKLHGNMIAKIRAVDRLSDLPLLLTLTLHGNDVEQTRGYKQYVISLLPHLKSLDFTSITPKDRRDAMTWKNMHGSRKSQPK